MLPSRCFLFTFVLSYGRFFKTLFKLFCFVSFSKKTYCLLGIYHSCMKGRRPSYSDATSFDMFRQVSTGFNMLRQVQTCYTTGLHRFLFVFQRYLTIIHFFLNFFLSCMYLCKLFFSSRLHSCFFSIHTAQNCFFLFILFYDCTTFVFLAMFWAP